MSEVLDLFGWTSAPSRPEPAASTPEPPASTPPPDDPARRTLALVRTVAPGIGRVVLTRNRRVMASLTGRGTTLRLNAAFAAAPAEVVLAAARLFTARDRRARERAKEAVRAFLRALPAAPAPQRRGPRPRSTEPGDLPLVARLQAEFDRVNAASFGGTLPRVPLHLSRRMRRRNGHFSRHPLEIVINRRLLTHAVPGEAEATLRHEMIHLWQHAAGKKPDHGPEFRARARKLDVHPRATRPVRWKAAA